MRDASRRVVAVVTGSVLLAGLGGCDTGASSADFLESFRDDDAAVAYVLEGTVPDGVSVPDEVPDDRPGRIGWILTRPDSDDDSLRLGVRDALDAEPDVLADLVLGVATVDEPLGEGGAETAFGALGDQPLSVLAAVGGSEPPADGVALDGDAVIATLAAAGTVPGEDGTALTQPLRDLVTDGLLADLQPAADLPQGEWAEAVATADADWAAPAARVWGSIARGACTQEPDGERCETLLEKLTSEIDGAVDQVVYETAPPAVLPAPLLLSGDREPLDDSNRDAWDAVLDGVGLDVAAQVRAAAGV